ncbi:hypothetical protein [Paraburkholderia sp. RL18-085-BIA-A]|uniref:hypothetical protein n=1 Tax=Paraburkholderia sp. RL18-085-BIA-A TaxID=3031633 RepID=UPI0038BCF8D6
MKPYAVEVSFTMIVMAGSEEGAQDVAEDYGHDAFRDDASKRFDVIGVVRTDAELIRHGWDGECLPYGGDGEAGLKTILAGMTPEPERDTRTVDMFGEQS